MSEHQADPIPAANAESVASADASPTASTTGESPKLSPEHGDAVTPDPAGADVAHIDPRVSPGRIVVMSPSRSDDSRQKESWQKESWQKKSWQEKPWQEKSWEEAINRPEPDADETASPYGKRRISALAAVVALAAVTGAVTGALATASLGRFMADDGRIAASRALEESVMRMDADITALKISTERAGKQTTSQFAKTSDRLDRIEKAQVEPAAKLAKLSETVEKLRVVPPSAPAPTQVPVAAAPAKEVTGTVAPPPKPEVLRLPTLDGWSVIDVANGGATIEGRQGIFEVYAGDPVPGLGRVDAIRKQDGRWTVVTSKGLIVPR